MNLEQQFTAKIYGTPKKKWLVKPIKLIGFKDEERVFPVFKHQQLPIPVGETKAKAKLGIHVDEDSTDETVQTDKRRHLFELAAAIAEFNNGNLEKPIE
jgi:hypothetical protein